MVPTSLNRAPRRRTGGAPVRELVVVGPTPPPYHGVAVMTGHLVDALDALGLLAGHLETTDPRPIETIGRLDLTNVRLGLRHALQLHRILTARPAAAVLVPISQGTWGFLRDALFVLVAGLHRRRLVLHLHGGGLTTFVAQSNRGMRWLIRTVFARADQAWALTPGLQAQFDGLVPSDRVTCLANVVQDPFAGDGEHSAGSRDDRTELHVLFLSNMLPDKGCFDVIAAVRLLGSRSQGWEVRLAGPAEPAVAARLASEIAALPSTAARVTLLGRSTGQSKAQLFRWADVFLYPTRYIPEGQPLVLLEAMAAGLPIVTTPRGGIPETVRDQREGLLVGEGDVEGVSRALLSLATEAGLRRCLGNAARARYERCYRPERLSDDLSALLRSPRAPASSENGGAASGTWRTPAPPALEDCPNGG